MISIQELQTEVQNLADEHLHDVLAQIIDTQLRVLDEIPSEFQTYSEYVGWCLDQYVAAKLLVHRIRRLESMGVGSSMVRDSCMDIDWLLSLKSAESKLRSCKARYYRAIGRKVRYGKR